MNIPSLETERLILRKFTIDDMILAIAVAVIIVYTFSIFINTLKNSLYNIMSTTKAITEDIIYLKNIK